MDAGQTVSLTIPGAASDIHLVPIPKGRFLMGSPNGLPMAPEAPEHFVDVNQFWMADSPVTQSQFVAVMNRNPSRFQGDPDLPVETVTWLEACEFCDLLAQKSGLPLRLPSEAEWEYACRAGSSTQFHFGDSSADLSAFAWFENNSREQTAPVKRKKPNAWGLFDIVGNVWEWCADLWHEDYTDAPVDGSAWLTPSSSSANRRHSVRGGAWDVDAFRCRSSYRSFDWEELGTSRTGFRVVIDSVPPIKNLPTK
jgi:formylglycine-generating enzyme required for sulfatase activity